MDKLKKIGSNIVKIRKQRKMTQEDLSGAAQIDRSYLSEVENGKENVSVKTLIKITEALECEFSDLIE